MKTNLKHVLIIVILILVAGCKSKKVVSTSEKSDTIIKNKVVTITPSQLNELVIDNPCDSLGNLKPFYYKTSSGKVNTIIKSKNDTIYVQQNIDSLKQVWEKEFISSYKAEKEQIIEEVEVWPWWLKSVLWYTFCLTLFVVIRFRKTIFQVVTKLLRLLKILPI